MHKLQNCEKLSQCLLSRSLNYSSQVPSEMIFKCLLDYWSHLSSIPEDTPTESTISCLLDTRQC